MENEENKKKTSTKTSTTKTSKPKAETLKASPKKVSEPSEPLVEKLKKYLKNEAVIAAIVLVVLIGGGYGLYTYMKQGDIGSSAIKTKVEKYLTSSIAGSKITITSVTSTDGLYKFNITVNTQKVVGYATKNGKLFFAQGYDMTTVPAPSK